MRNNHLFRWFFIVFIISFLFSTCTDGKGFGGGRGGGGFRGGGSRGGGSFGGSKGTGTFGGSSSYNRYGSYNSMNKPRSGSNFKSNAMSFGAGALGGVAAYSLMRSMSHSYHSGPGYYQRGYGTGETCMNNEDMNGTRFGSFRCPLNEFPHEAKYCCGEIGKQYCCIREGGTYRSRFNTSNFGWIFLIVIICLIALILFVKHRRNSRKDVVMIPMEPPADEQRGPLFYHPPPPPMGYPPPPMSYPPPPGGNPYAVPPQTHEGNFNPYPQQHQMPYPPQQQMPYPPQQQQPYNPYQVKEGGPPAYDDAVRNNPGVPLTKPT